MPFIVSRSQTLLFKSEWTCSQNLCQHFNYSLCLPSFPGSSDLHRSQHVKKTNKQTKKTNKKTPLSLYEKLPRVAITFLANMLIWLPAQQPFHQEAMLTPQEGRAGAGQVQGRAGERREQSWAAYYCQAPYRCILFESLQPSAITITTTLEMRKRHLEFMKRRDNILPRVSEFCH